MEKVSSIRLNHLNMRVYFKKVCLGFGIVDYFVYLCNVRLGITLVVMNILIPNFSIARVNRDTIN